MCKFAFILLLAVSAFPELPLEVSGNAFPPLPVEEVVVVEPVEEEQPKDYCVNGNCGQQTEDRTFRLRLFRRR